MKSKCIICVSVLISIIISSLSANASVEWTLKKELNLQATPLDLSQSPDGKLIYILVPGKILIYSLSDKKLLDFLPVDKSADRLLSGINSSFIVSNAITKSLKLYQLETRQRIDVSRLPYKGPEDAPITVAVYSDYQ